MASVRFTRHLLRFFPRLEEGRVPARDVRGLVQALELRHPGLASYLCEDQGGLRTHVNIFVDGRPLADRASLAFGSTTGNVYAGSDGGERRKAVGQDFPPVYSVRFAP